MRLLKKPCDAYWHGSAGMPRFTVPSDEYNPSCQTCRAREILDMHDHLHLGATVTCVTPGITGTPGEMVRCRCGSFHH